LYCLLITILNPSNLNAVESPFNVPQFVFFLGFVFNSKDTLNGNFSTDYKTVMINIPLIDHSRYHLCNNCRNMYVEFDFLSDQVSIPSCFVVPLNHSHLHCLNMNTVFGLKICNAVQLYSTICFYRDWNYLLLLICLRVALQSWYFLAYVCNTQVLTKTVK
jgi:hypothetical protein